MIIGVSSRGTRKLIGSPSLAACTRLADARLVASLLRYQIKHGIGNGSIETPTRSLAGGDPTLVGIAAQRAFYWIDGSYHTATF